MEKQPRQEPLSPLDQATAARLAKLAAMPVDVSQLERAFRAELGHTQTREGRLRIGWARPLRAAAGFIILAIIASVLFTLPGGRVMASTSELAKFHEDLVAGKGIVQVDSVSQANQAIARQWAESPTIPNVPREHVMACCMKSIHNKKVVCVLLKGEREPVTLTVANAHDMAMPESSMIEEAGHMYHITASGALNMVMTERQGRWVCLIARLPVARLMALADGLQF